MIISTYGEEDDEEGDEEDEDEEEDEEEEEEEEGFFTIINHYCLISFLLFLFLKITILRLPLNMQK